MLARSRPPALRGLALAAAGVLAALALAGCGGGHRQDAQAFRRRVAAVCDGERRRSAALAVPRSPAQAGGYLRQGLPLVRSALAQLRAIRAPAALAPTYARALGLLGSELDLIEGAAARIARGADTSATLRALDPRLTPMLRAEDTAWRSLGLPQCTGG